MIYPLEVLSFFEGENILQVDDRQDSGFQNARDEIISVVPRRALIGPGLPAQPQRDGGVRPQPGLGHASVIYVPNSCIKLSLSWAKQNNKYKTCQC